MTTRAAARSAAPAAADDRRFRRAPSRAIRRKPRAWRSPVALVQGAVFVLGALLIVAFAIRTVVMSSKFHVERIVVHGNQRLATGEVIALLDGLRGQHALTVDLDTWRARLMGSPWVADARLHRVLPGTIEVSIVERVPLANARIEGHLFLVDERGVVIDEYGPQYADVDLPIIDGLTGTEEVSPARQTRSVLVARLLGALAARRDLLNRISQIDVHDERNAVVILAENGTRVQLGESSFTERLQSYVELAPALQSRVSDIDYVDLRFEPRVFVRPVARTETAR